MWTFAKKNWGLYAIDTAWWIAILTPGKTEKLDSNTHAARRRASLPRLKRYISRNWEALLKPIRFDDDGGITPKARESGKTFEVGWLSGLAPKIIPAFSRLHNRGEWNREYMHIRTHIHICIYTHIYRYVYTRTCHQFPPNPSDPRPS